MYRVSINGLQCIQQTWDDALERDGKGDEIRLTWSVARRTPPTGTTSGGKSQVFGDVNGFPDRTKAGTASALGGIKTGDTVPIRVTADQGSDGIPLPKFPFMPQLYAHPAWSNVPQDGFPFVVWQGELSPDEIVGIVPLVWELDPGNDNPKPALEVSGAIASAVLEAIGTVVPGAGIIGAAVGVALSVIAANIGFAGSRPVGANNADEVTHQTWPELSFSAATIDAVVAENSGYGPGVYRHVQRDPAAIGGGEFALYIQVAKV